MKKMFTIGLGALFCLPMITTVSCGTKHKNTVEIPELALHKFRTNINDKFVGETVSEIETIEDWVYGDSNISNKLKLILPKISNGYQVRMKYINSYSTDNHTSFDKVKMLVEISSSNFKDENSIFNDYVYVYAPRSELYTNFGIEAQKFINRVTTKAKSKWNLSTFNTMRRADLYEWNNLGMMELPTDFSMTIHSVDIQDSYSSSGGIVKLMISLNKGTFTTSYIYLSFSTKDNIFDSEKIVDASNLRNSNYLGTTKLEYVTDLKTNRPEELTTYFRNWDEYLIDIYEINQYFDINLRISSMEIALVGEYAGVLMVSLLANNFSKEIDYPFDIINQELEDRKAVASSLAGLTDRVTFTDLSRVTSENFDLEYKNTILRMLGLDYYYTDPHITFDVRFISKVERNITVEVVAHKNKVIASVQVVLTSLNIVTPW